MIILESFIIYFLWIAKEFLQLLWIILWCVFYLYYHAIITYYKNEIILQIIVLEVYFKDKDETHLWFCRQGFYHFMHQNIFFRLLIRILGSTRRRLIKTLSLNDNFHFDIIDAILTTGIHHGEKDSELLSCAYFSKRGVVI